MDEDNVSDDLVGEGQVDITRFRNSANEQEGKYKHIQKLCNCTFRGKLQAK